MARRRKKGLTAEDRELWERVAQTATPLDHVARRPMSDADHGPDHSKSSPKPLPDRRAPASTLPSFRIGERAPHLPGAVASARTLSDRLAEAPVRMDHGHYKKMQRGKMKPEARIDLHGMTLAQAHPVLNRFILDAFEDGKRLVLVITGKGKDRDSGDPIPIRRGVLRHQVPNWLHAPPLGAMVLEIREAHQRHGGGGAYYVYHKRRR